MRKSIYLLKTTPSSHTHRFHPLPLATPTSCSPHPLATPIHSTHSLQLSSILKMEASHEQYSTHSETIKAAACEQYSKHPEKKNVLPLDGTIALIVRKSVHTPENSIVIILPKKGCRTYLALNRDNICAQKRAKYVLAEPNPDVKHM